MSNKWAWIIGIVGTAGVAFSILFFVVTQNATLRDLSAIGVGMLLGATIAAVAAVSVFHSDERTRRIAEHKALIGRKLKLIDALPTRADQIDRLLIKVTGLKEGIARVQAQGRAQTEVAKSATYDGFREDAATAEGEVEALKHTAEGLSEQKDDVDKELARLRAMTDDAYLSEQTKLRGLD